jgi:hypothetical protein
MRGHPREQQYYRHFAIESNLLELTFALTSKVSFPVAISITLRAQFDIERKTADTRRVRRRGSRVAP